MEDKNGVIPRTRRKRLSFTALLILSVGFLVIFLGLGIWRYYSEGVTLEKSLDSKLEVVSKTVQHALTDPLYNNDPLQAGSIIDAFLLDCDFFSIEVLNGFGRPFVFKTNDIYTNQNAGKTLDKQFGVPYYDQELGKVTIRFSRKSVQDKLRQLVARIAGENLLTAFLILCLAYIFIRFNILLPVKQTSQALRDIAQGSGDLKHRLSILKENEIGELSHWFNVFADKQSNLIKVIQTSSGNLDRLSSLMAESSKILTNQNQIQNANIEGIGASMKQFSNNLDLLRADILKEKDFIVQTVRSIRDLSSKIEEVAEKTFSIKNTVEKNSLAAENSLKIVDDSISQTIVMNEILNELGVKIRQVGEQSSNIDKILKVIKEIADQTNILSMNSAIEASHAGNAGKGFSIVASEIRRLAQNVSESVKEIGSFLKKIQEGVQQAFLISEKGIVNSAENAKKVREARSALTDIMSSITSIHSTVSEINRLTRMEGDSVTDTLQHSSDLDAFAEKISQHAEENGKVSVQISEAIKEFGEATGLIMHTTEDLESVTGQLRKESEAMVKDIAQFDLN
jgi:methyl-accepting chemotaxis protein